MDYVIRIGVVAGSSDRTQTQLDLEPALLTAEISTGAAVKVTSASRSQAVRAMPLSPAEAEAP